MANTAIEKLKEDEREKRKEIILLAAQRLFSQNSIARVNMRDIAMEAGVSVGFIYRYFTGQSDIFLELFETGAAELCEKITASVADEKTSPMRALARTYINYLHDNSMFYEMMIYFMLEGELPDGALERLNASLRRIVDGVEMFFKNNAKERNSRTLAHGFFAALNGIMISFVNYPGRSPHEIKERTLVLADTIADRFEQGDK